MTPNPGRKAREFALSRPIFTSLPCSLHGENPGHFPTLQGIFQAKTQIGFLKNVAQSLAENLGAENSMKNTSPSPRPVWPRLVDDPTTNPKPKPETPQEIRELLRHDPAAASDAHLIALVLATGTRVRGVRQGKSSWSSSELASALLAEAGGHLCDLVRATCADTLEWRRFGVGRSIGARLIAAMELAERWRVGAGTAVGHPQSAVDPQQLSEAVFQRRRVPSAVELLALLLGVKSPDVRGAQRVLEVFGSCRELIATLSLDAFEPQARSNGYLCLSGSDLVIEIAALCRLVAAVELARRHRGKPVIPSGELEAIGVSSENLKKLLDPATPLEPELRQSLIEQLRHLPELADDFAALDRLTDDAGIDEYLDAVEVHRMLLTLERREEWRHPAEIVGEPVPYGALLRMARAWVHRGVEPSSRLGEVLELLEQAEREAASRPVADFVEALRRLRLSESGGERALEEARRGYWGGTNVGAR